MLPVLEEFQLAVSEIPTRMLRIGFHLVKRP
jgi:hypothetical protein